MPVRLTLRVDEQTVEVEDHSADGCTRWRHVSAGSTVTQEGRRHVAGAETTRGPSERCVSESMAAQIARDGSEGAASHAVQLAERWQAELLGSKVVEADELQCGRLRRQVR